MTGKRLRALFDFKVLVLLILACLFILVWWLQNREEQKIAEKIRPPVYVMTPQRQDLNKTFELTATIESESMITVLPRLSGNLTGLFVDVGDDVELNEVIGQVEEERYQLQLQQARAGFLAAESTFQRVKSLYQSNATTRQNYDQAEAQYESARSQKELAELQMDYTKIKAPVSGVVLKKHTSAGSMVAPQIPIVTIGKLTDLVIRAKIPEEYYQFFQKHRSRMTLNLTVPALGDKTFAGRVRTISPYISPETKNFETLCDIETGEAPLRPGMFAYVSFVLDQRKNIYTLPFSTLTSEGKLWYVERESQRAQTMDFSLSYHNDQAFQVSEEMANRRFIYDGQHFIREGQEVRILNRNQKAPSSQGGQGP